eukprot:6183366-Pleurochrysis_carterae.AAC.4
MSLVVLNLSLREFDDACARAPAVIVVWVANVLNMLRQTCIRDTYGRLPMRCNGQRALSSEAASEAS